MNELQMISAALEESPSERTTAEGRARLLAEIADPGRATAPARRRRFSLPRWGLGLGLAGVTAAAVAVAVAVSGTTPADPPPGKQSATDLSARAVLLAAAERAESIPVAQGRYWHVKRMYAISLRVGPERNPYTMERLNIEETWTDRKGRSWTGHREVGARPKTPADAEAWKRDGSPTRWDLGPADTVQGGRSYLYGTPRPGTVVAMDPPHGFYLYDGLISFEELRRLPADPKRLSARLLDAGRGGDLTGFGRDVVLAGALANLLAGVPVTPEVRAAAFRALAALPSARGLGAVKDPQGRPGVGIGIAQGGLTLRMIVDPRTSFILSSTAAEARRARPGVSGKERETAFLEVGWTDTKPGVPALP
ncbi:CU044_5270 family protein [Thermomonospora umbrina]|uniref:CU044_5270 family protein n=1 Tax=Thermomonospora umbrina TaxID=111806 RepID=A0A3D9SSS3_9ACTN|nr:CU044_5270 family protein [Thermomonospora umbrina]REE97043.1 hypothetical protein DFJ69_2499 [Thermomonospora umbrina]